MAAAFTTEYQCFDCERVYQNERSAELCHTDYLEIFRCEICNKHYLVRGESEMCCRTFEGAKDVRVFIEPRAAATAINVVNAWRSGELKSPKPDCEFCGIAQRFGRVIYCRCMRNDV